MKKLAASLLVLLMILAPPVFTANGELTPEEKQKIVEYVKRINKEVADCKEQAEIIEEECDDKYNILVKRLDGLEDRIEKLENSK